MSIYLDDGTGAKLQQTTNQATYAAAVSTTAATSTTPFGYATSTQADAVVSRVNSILAALVAQGIMKAS
jgi:hypothetical protein